MPAVCVCVCVFVCTHVCTCIMLSTPSACQRTPFARSLLFPFAAPPSQAFRANGPQRGVLGCVQPARSRSRSPTPHVRSPQGRPHYVLSLTAAPPRTLLLKGPGPALVFPMRMLRPKGAQLSKVTQPALGRAGASAWTCASPLRSYFHAIQMDL